MNTTATMYIGVAVFVAICCAVWHKNCKDSAKEIARLYSGKAKDALMSIVNREKFLVYCGIFLVCAGLPSAWIISETEKETAFFLSAVLMITGIALGNKFGQHGKSAWVWRELASAIYRDAKAAKMPDMPGSILGDMSLFHVKTLKKKLEDDLHIYHYDDDNYPSSDELAAMRTTKP